MSTPKIVRLSLLLGLALILAYIETLLPLPLPLPGLKLGLPNMVILYILNENGYREALLVSFARVLMISLLFGTLFSPAFIISFFAALFSWGAMSLAVCSGKFSLPGASILGAATHNAVQILIAGLLLQTRGVLYFLPFLLGASVPLGIMTGGIVLNLNKRIIKR